MKTDSLVSEFSFYFQRRSSKMFCSSKAFTLSQNITLLNPLKGIVLKGTDDKPNHRFRCFDIRRNIT